MATKPRNNLMQIENAVLMHFMEPHYQAPGHIMGWPQGLCDKFHTELTACADLVYPCLNASREHPAKAIEFAQAYAALLPVLRDNLSATIWRRKKPGIECPIEARPESIAALEIGQIQAIASLISQQKQRLPVQQTMAGVS